MCSSVSFIGNTATCQATLSTHEASAATLALGADYGGQINSAASDAGPLYVSVLALTEAIFHNGFDDPGDPDVCPIE